MNHHFLLLQLRVLLRLLVFLLLLLPTFAVDDESLGCRPSSIDIRQVDIKVLQQLPFDPLLHFPARVAPPRPAARIPPQRHVPQPLSLALAELVMGTRGRIVVSSSCSCSSSLFFFFFTSQRLKEERAPDLARLKLVEPREPLLAPLLDDVDAVEAHRGPGGRLVELAQLPRERDEGPVGRVGAGSYDVSGLAAVEAAWSACVGCCCCCCCSCCSCCRG